MVLQSFVALRGKIPSCFYRKCERKYNPMILYHKSARDATRFVGNWCEYEDKKEQPPSDETAAVVFATLDNQGISMGGTHAPGEV